MGNAISLDVIEIASPCAASWDEMAGDDRSRFCSHCQLNVYNLSEMTREEAEALLAKREGHTCVRLYRREDGTVLTRDCPIGLRAVRKQCARAIAAIAAIWGGMAACMLFGRIAPGQAAPSGARQGPLARFTNWVYPVQTIAMGGMCAPPFGNVISVVPNAPNNGGPFDSLSEAPDVAIPMDAIIDSVPSESPAGHD